MGNRGDAAALRFSNLPERRQQRYISTRLLSLVESGGEIVLRERRVTAQHIDNGFVVRAISLHCVLLFESCHNRQPESYKIDNRMAPPIKSGMIPKNTLNLRPMQPDTDKLTVLLDHAERLLIRLENLLPPAPPEPDWDHCTAFRWRKQRERGYLQPVRHPHRLRLRDLQCIDRQKTELERNVRQFLAGRPFNNALLWGARGTGKSSLLKALLNEYAGRGLRLIEVDKQELIDLPAIVEPLYERPERFMLFCDDLSFTADDPSYKALKAMLDGSISSRVSLSAHAGCLGIGYNLVTLPLAAAGRILPWMAALGMSLSSLLVVANALRLKKA